MGSNSIGERTGLLTQWARTIEKAAGRGLFGGRPIGLRNCAIVNGPRAGALEIDAGIEAGVMLKTLQANESALLRQFVPYDFVGDPACFMTGRRLRLEAGWPSQLAESDISLKALGQHPAGDGRWLLGKTERGSVLTAGLDDKTPHWLVSGTTGAGKTVSLVSAICQLAREKSNRLILIDAKHGASFKRFSNLQGLVGPVCCDVYEAQAALSWTASEIAKRYSDGHDARRLVLIVDEVQELSSDSICQEAIKRIVAQGRGCGVHAILATQHPNIASLGGPTVGRNLVGRIALRVADYDASRVAVGSSTPRADRLLGCGDSYAIAPNATHRVQVAHFDGDAPTGAREMENWPDVTSLPDSNCGWPGADELGAAMSAAIQGYGRVKFQRAAADDGVEVGGNDRAVRLLNLARGAIEWMDDHGMSVRPDGDMRPKRATKMPKNDVRERDYTRTDGHE